MPKKFFTDTDIEELHRKGVKSLQMTDDVVLTDLAYEKAKRLGVQLLFDHADAPPAAPVRPYLSDKEPRRTQPKPDSVSQASPHTDIESRLRAAVLAKLGTQVDAQLLDNIIHRVVKATGLK
jgi:hypothetical protein